MQIRVFCQIGSPGSEDERMKSFEFDPRAFILPPYIKCPECGKEAFGVLDIGGTEYWRRCKDCLFPEGDDPSATYALPELNKKVIYLDQLAISNMMKALNPQTKAYGRDGLVFWRRLFERLDRLCKLQLIICPSSEFHTNESLTSPWYKPLKRMCDLLSHGTSCHPKARVRSGQVLNYARNWISGKPEQPGKLERSDLLPRDINSWQERYVVTVDTSYDAAWVKELRRSRSRTHLDMSRFFERWRADKTRTFDDWFTHEALGYGKGYLEAYQSYMNDFIPRTAALTVNSIQDAFVKAAVDEAEIWPKTEEFLTSDTLKNVPFIQIAALMCAGIARQAAAGRKEPPNTGMANDIFAISLVLPYCDAMFVDNECRYLLTGKPMCDALKYGTRLFSANVKEAFIKYLEHIEEEAPPEHFEKVREVYGEEWPKPYTGLYAKHV